MSNKVAVVMGSQSDWDTMKHCVQQLKLLHIEYKSQILSAHRMPDEMFHFAENAREQGYAVVIAGAGGAAHLPGMLAAKTSLPVIGVPVQSRALSGLDSLLSIAQMPGGVPVATMSIGESGAKNAALLAASILGIHDPVVQAALEDFRQNQTQSVKDMELPDE